MLQLVSKESSGRSGRGICGKAVFSPVCLWFCIRYVERNLVRAGIVERAGDYPWSSAAAHCGLKEDALLTTDPVHWKNFMGITDWSTWPHEKNDQECFGIV